MVRYDVAIAGAGPAGLAAALLLHRDGHRVTIFERFEAPRPLGSGLILQPTGLAVLRELGLADRMLALGRRIDRLFGRVAQSDRIVLDVQYRNLGAEYFGLAVHRAALFDPLFEAAQSDGIPIQTRCAVAGVDGGGGRPTLVMDNGRKTGPFDLVVDAMGVRSSFAAAYGGRPRMELPYGALWASLPWPSGAFNDHALEQRYYRASIMVGVLPIGRRGDGQGDEAAFFWSIRPPDYQAWREAGLEAWKTRVRLLWPQTAPLLDTITDADQMTLARYSHHTLATPVADRLAVIGDSAHAASPQLGQGANMALLDARALAIALRESRDLATALAAYMTMRRWHIRFYQAMSALFTPFYQSDSRMLPVLRDWIVAPSTRLPGIRNVVAGLVAGVILDPRRQLQLSEGMLRSPLADAR